MGRGQGTAAAVGPSGRCPHSAVDDAPEMDGFDQSGPDPADRVENEVARLVVWVATARAAMAESIFAGWVPRRSGNARLPKLKRRAVG